MVETDSKQVEVTKKKIYSVFGDMKSSLFIIALILVLIVRIYFFFMAQNQPLWWDESEYMSGAKAYAGLVDYGLSSIRSPGFSLIASVFFKFGLDSDFMLRLFLALIPSLLVIILTYYVSREMYDDNRVAIISMLAMAFLWEHIFYSNRFHTENFSLIFQYLAILVLFKGYVKKEKFFSIDPKYSLILVAVLSVIAVIFRPGNIIFVPALILFIPLVNMKFLRTHAKVSRIVLLALLLVGLLCLFNLDKIPIVSSYYAPNNPISFSSLSVFYGFYAPSAIIPGVLFYLFLVGTVIALVGLWLRFPLIKEFKRDSTDLETKSDIFSLLLIVCVMFAFIFLMRVSTFEFRWFFPLAIGMLALTAKGTIRIGEYLGKFSKDAPTYFILIILALSLYGQFDYSKDLVQSKRTSYEQVKEAGLWIKDNSNPSDVIISASIPQNTYYSERQTVGFSLNSSEQLNESQFNQGIKELKPRYVVVSAFEPSFTPQWAYNWAINNQNTTTAVQVYYADASKQQPVLVIYEVKYGK